MDNYPFDKIPLIDFSPFKANHPLGKHQVATEIYHACHRTGFLYLYNHGIPEAVIATAFEQSRLFFDLTLQEKQKLAWSNEAQNRGYIGWERERLDETQPGDLKEAFNIGWDSSIEKELPPKTAAFKTLWPDQEAFFSGIRQFFQACAQEAADIFRAFAIALSMPENFFTDEHSIEQSYTLRLLHYPPLQIPPKPGQMRAGAHSDYGTLTLLFQDSIGGLEVFNPNLGWLQAAPLSGAILINTGDLMERWSNNKFRSTKHRVHLPEPDQANKHRYSMAFFCQPNPDTIVSCLPTCQNQDNPAHYPPIQSGEYLLERLRATY